MTNHARELACSFCGRSSPNKLIAGPAIMICDECVATAARMARETGIASKPAGGANQVHVAEGGGFLGLFGKKLRIEPTCSFCGKSPPALVQPPSTLGTHALICGECLDLCQDLIAERLGR